MTEDPREARFEGVQLIIETADETEVYDSQFLVALFHAILELFKKPSKR